MPSSELSVMFYYVYVLKSIKYDQVYIGFTKGINNRLIEHNNGRNKSTKPYLPWEIIYFEAHRNTQDARRREKYLKTTNGKQALNRMLREYLGESKSSIQKVYN